MDFAATRRTMVDCQILPSRVTDPRLIDAMMELPRELFVPDARKSLAYVDEAIDLGDGRYLMEPMVSARLLQTLDLKPGDVALSIGCGSGYNVALLGKIVDTVVAVEADGRMVKKAEAILSDLGIDNVAVMEGPLNAGAPKQAPYDVIFFDGAVDAVPEAISQQLAEDGRLVAMIKKPGGLCCAHYMQCNHGVVSGRDVFDASTPELPGFQREQAFQF